MKNKLVVVRGAGDLATGVIYILSSFGYRVVATEVEKPSAIRRTVALSEAVYVGRYSVENITGVLCEGLDKVNDALCNSEVPVVIDPRSDIIKELKPDIVVDAIIAKKNLGTSMDMAPIVIGVGPGFSAGKDVQAVVETSRGHQLGRVITKGEAAKNTGVPGKIEGYGHERVIYAPADGIIENLSAIGDHVEAGHVIAKVAGCPVKAKISGVLRGLIRDGFAVTKGMKTADVDPRNVYGHCFTISDKARMVGYGTLFAINELTNKQGESYAD